MNKEILNIFFDKLKSVILLIFFAFLSNQNTLAQVQNNGTIYVGQNSSLYTSGMFTFGTSSITKTERGSGLNHGKLVFGASATASGANTATTQFVDGFANTRKSGDFDLPTGDGTIYAPVRVSNTTVTNGVEAAYSHTTPTNNTDFDASITAILSTGYWEIKGDDAKISLIWSTNIGSDFNAFADITVAGYNSTTGKWEAINCDTPTGSLSSGTVTTTSVVTLATYTAFTLGEKGVSCAPLITATGSKSWTGSAWSPLGAPTLSDAVILNGDYPSTEGSFVCNSLAMGVFNVTLTDTQSIEVVNDVTGTGKIFMSSEASFVQRKSTGTAPNIELTKTTRAIKRYDYVYWGAPVSENVFSQLAAAQVTGNATGAFDLMYSYTSGVLGTGGGWQVLSATNNGKGFITRVKEQAPFTDGTTTGRINLKFTGTANNGDLLVSVAKVALDDTSARNNNLLANPYPCAIDADKFLTENSTLLDGVIYLWRANNTNSGAAGQAYALADYIAYTKAGSTGYAGTSTAASVSFNGLIASGQGFKVKALASGDVKFTNCMRVAVGNTQFFRTTNQYAIENTTVVDRFKVSLSNSSGVANQILVAYLPQTTLAYDNMYDAELLSVSTTKMYSILDNDSKKLAINARPSFATTDQVAIGFTKADATSTQMSMQVTDTEGVFANNQTPIFLYDTQLNVYHNFANGAYSFNATTQEDNTRFKIVYQNALLGNTDFDALQTIATLNDNVLKVNSKLTIEAVKVFDMTGRLVLEVTPENKDITFVTDFNQAVGVYVVKVTLINGQIITSKLINKN